MIKGIQGFDAELKALRLAELEVLRQREISHRVGLVAQIVQRRRDGTQAEGSESKEAGRVKRRNINAVLLALTIILSETALQLGHVALVVQRSGSEQERLA